MSIAPEIPETLSPYWLRLYGKWIHLEGISPENDVTSQRQFNELLTVDGYRYVQTAPRGPRTWTLSYEYGTASAVAALEAAAYTVPLSATDDPAMRTLLLDTNAAEANMLPPEMPTQGTVLDGYPVINAGGVWQPAYDVVSYGVPIRIGVTYTVAVWTAATGGSTVLQVTVDGAITNYQAAGGGTVDNPELVTVVITPATDQDVRVAATSGPGPTASTSGLMVFEGDCPPTHYRRGQRTPCQVSVQDPALTVNPIWPRGCDPCDLPRQQATFTVLEVGENPVSGTDIV